MKTMCIESFRDDGKATRPGAADRLSLALSLAATPSFALMALLTTGVFDGGSGVHGSMAHGTGGPVDGMVLMYLLMSFFHAAPWLKLLAIRRRRKQQT